MRRMSAFNLAAIVLGIGFLYLPIVVLVIYSFNDSRLVSVWGGWSLRWYAELARDAPLIDSAMTSLRLGAARGDGGDGAGDAFGAGAGAVRTLPRPAVFSAMIYAPLVMPEVITGLSLLLLFVAIAVDRGFWTVAIAHTTMAMCFVTVIVQSRLADFDLSLEEAAMDLGASPLRTFLSVTLPLILPAIAAAWMLSFALSLDDLVIASFTTGPGATTLPIRIYSEVRLGVKPEMNAVCSIMVGVVGVAVIAASLLGENQWRTRLRAGVTARDRPGRSVPALARGPEQVKQNQTGTITSEPSNRFGSAQARPARASFGEPVGGKSRRPCISSSVVMPKCARIVPDDQRRYHHLDQCACEAVEHPAAIAGAKARADSCARNHNATAVREHARRNKEGGCGYLGAAAGAGACRIAPSACR